MKIRFLNVDLEIESPDNLQPLVDELAKGCSISIHDERRSGNNFAVFTPQLASVNDDLNTVISLFCDSIENLSPESREIWKFCQIKRLDAGFESGTKPENFQTEIRADVLKRVAELGASVAITIYPIND